MGTGFGLVCSQAIHVFTEVDPCIPGGYLERKHRAAQNGWIPRGLVTFLLKFPLTPMMKSVLTALAFCRVAYPPSSVLQHYTHVIYSFIETESTSCILNGPSKATVSAWQQAGVKVCCLHEYTRARYDCTGIA